MRISTLALIGSLLGGLAACAEEDANSLTNGQDPASDNEEAMRKYCKDRGNSLHCDAGAGDAAADAPKPLCIAFSYSPYAACQPDNTQSRTVIASTPDGCVGGNPILSQACVYVPPAPATCADFTYSEFGACQPNNTQTRTVVSAAPAGCIGGTPIVSQACTYVAPVVPCTSFTYSTFGACMPDNTQIRSVLTSSPAGCTGGTPALTQSCTYIPPAVLCSSFTYTDFGACQPNNTQTRTVVSAAPVGCTGGTPALSQACTYTPPGPRDYKTFDGSSLTANRKIAALGVDQRRVKPFSALETELPRVLGATPASLAGAASTFGAPPVRWYEEPSVSAVGLQKSLEVAFDGCLTFTATATVFSAAPTSASATTQCTAMGRKFWQQTPTAAAIQPCVSVATTATASVTDVRRRWAYACTALLNASPFLTY